ncbi:hypothetical protein EDB84DRAFT_1575990 [Lactarius hengduanensis]|nr:hypothetical protein EDB84DRAFT_1575990 [Lactarius hengduanensis]
MAPCSEVAILVHTAVKTIVLTANGKTTTATIVDMCPGCPYGGLDLTRGLFHFLDNSGIEEMQGSWHFASDGGDDQPTTQPVPTTTTTHKPKPTPTPTPTPEPSPSPKHTTTSTHEPSPSPSTTSTSSKEPSTTSTTTPTTTSKPHSSTTSSPSPSPTSSLYLNPDGLAQPAGVIPDGQSPQNLESLNEVITNLGAIVEACQVLTPGGLLWTRNGVPRDEVAHDRLKREKRAALPEDLARGLPEEFEEFLRYCRSLSFAQKPDYAYWRERFRDLAKDLGYKDIDRFIWPPPPVPLAAEVVVVSDGESSGEYGPVHRHNKAARITKLTQAADNRVLARLMEDFVKVLRNSNSRTLTREGFGFLDALHKQLADPSMFIVPPRSSKTRSSRSQRDQESAAAAEDAPYEDHSRLYGLCASLEKAQDNKTVAGLVVEFGALIDRTAGRKLTKEAFLEIVADRLLVVRV